MKKILLSSFLLACFASAQAQISLTNNINPGAGNSNPGGFAELNGKLYFSADDDINGRELWCYNPTTNTSQMVYNIGPGASSGGYGAIATEAINGKLYFGADNNVNGEELWAYDGINAPYMVADINPGGAGSDPYDFVVLNNKLYFSAEDPEVGCEMFVYDPATNIAQYVADISTVTPNSNPDDKIVYNNKIYFSAAGDNGYELYVYDPVNNTTVMVADINAGPVGSDPSEMMIADNKLYFLTDEGDRQLYCYTGSGLPIRITNFSSGSDRAKPIIFNEKMYVHGDDGLGSELYTVDLVTHAISIVYDIVPGTGGSYYEPAFYKYSGKLFFEALTPSSGKELWSYDGINPPAMVEDLNPGAIGSDVYLRGVFENRLYFSATNGVDGNELFYYQDPYFSVAEYNSNVNTVAYPIPASDNVNIRITLDETASFYINIYDITGKLVYTLPTTDYMVGTNEINIPLQTLAKGSYQYSLVNSKGVMGTGKIIHN